MPSCISCEVDKAACRLGMHQFDADVVADLQAFVSTLQSSLNRRPADAYPRPLFGCARHDRIEPLTNAMLQQERRGRLPHQPLHFVGRVLALRTSLRDSL